MLISCLMSNAFIILLTHTIFYEIKVVLSVFTGQTSIYKVIKRLH